MLKRGTSRGVLAIIFAVAGLAVVTAPAMAETVLVGCTGTCGYYPGTDTGPAGGKGAVCVYQTSYPYEVNKMTVRPPLMHGDYAAKTKVGWRFDVQRKNVNGGSWSTIYNSTYQTALANNAIPAYAGHGFSRRAWSAPAHPAGYYYRIVIEMKWWKSGSVKGYAKLKYDWYKGMSGTNTNVQEKYCLASY